MRIGEIPADCPFLQQPWRDAGATGPPRFANFAAAAPTLSGDPAHPGRTSGWVDTRLYFGLGPADHPEQGISEAGGGNSSIER